MHDKIVGFVHTYLQKHTKSPSVRDVMVGINSKEYAVVRRYIWELQDTGAIPRIIAEDNIEVSSGEDYNVKHEIYGFMRDYKTEEGDYPSLKQLKESTGYDDKTISNVIEVLKMEGVLPKNFKVEKNLSKSKEAIISFVNKYTDKHGYCPTIREISDGVGLSSTGTTYQHVRDLARKGYIDSELGKTRTARVKSDDVVKVVATNKDSVPSLIEWEGRTYRLEKQK